MCDKTAAKIVDVEGGKISEKKPDEVRCHARILAAGCHKWLHFVVRALCPLKQSPPHTRMAGTAGKALRGREG